MAYWAKPGVSTQRPISGASTSTSNAFGFTNRTPRLNKGTSLLSWSRCAKGANNGNKRNKLRITTCMSENRMTHVILMFCFLYIMKLMS